MEQKRSRWLLVAAIVTAVACTVAYFVVFSTTHWFFDNYTLSTRSYREWPFGFKSDQRTERSAFEVYLVDTLRIEVKHDWSHGCQGYNVFDKPIYFADPALSPTASLHDSQLAEWIKRHKPEEIRALYELFVSGEDDAISVKVDEIMSEAGA